MIVYSCDCEVWLYLLMLVSISGSPPGSYSQDIPIKLNPTSPAAPPTLPPQLLQVILNTEAPLQVLDVLIVNFVASWCNGTASDLLSRGRGFQTSVWSSSREPLWIVTAAAVACLRLQIVNDAVQFSHTSSFSFPLPCLARIVPFWA